MQVWFNTSASNTLFAHNLWLQQFLFNALVYDVTLHSDSLPAIVNQTSAPRDPTAPARKYIQPWSVIPC